MTTDLTKYKRAAETLREFNLDWHGHTIGPAIDVAVALLERCAKGELVERKDGTCLQCGEPSIVFFVDGIERRNMCDRWPRCERKRPRFCAFEDCDQTPTHGSLCREHAEDT